MKKINTRTLDKVIFGNSILESIEVKTGLKQGDTLAPVLFNLALEKVVRSSPIRYDMKILSGSTLLVYADDINII